MAPLAQRDHNKLMLVVLMVVMLGVLVAACALPRTDMWQCAAFHRVGHGSMGRMMICQPLLLPFGPSASLVFKFAGYAPRLTSVAGVGLLVEAGVRLRLVAADAGFHSLSSSPPWMGGGNLAHPIR